MIRQFRRALTMLCLVTLASAAPGKADEFVDVELVLAVDISFSISVGEQDIQREGYAAAFRDAEVIRTITGGLHGRIAVTYLEWAGPELRVQVVPWTLISTPADAHALADALAQAPIQRGGRTSMSAAMATAGYLFAQSPYQSLRRIIDISGDGPNNFGGPVRAARDTLIARGVTINGLPLIGNAGSTDAPVDIADYYSDCVIGGPGAFSMTVTDWADFEPSIKRKLILEIAGHRPAPRIILTGGAVTDCLAGERAERQRYIDNLNGITGGKPERWMPNEESWPSPAE